VPVDENLNPRGRICKGAVRAMGGIWTVGAAMGLLWQCTPELFYEREGATKRQ